MAPSAASSEDLHDARNIVGINKETVTNVTTTEFPGHYAGEDHAWDVEDFRSKLSVNFHKNEQFDASFSLIGVDASIANAFRRILIAEIPTLAIETVFIDNNTSVIQDEVLAHRLGLIPFKGGRDGLRNFLKDWRPPGEDEGKWDTSFDYNTVKLSLNVECTKNADAAENETDPTKLYHHAHVYAKDLEFMPMGQQDKYFSGKDAIMPVNPDILIAKLRPNQVIHLDVHMHKGKGSEHAKFSPVCTASYRLLPTIDILEPIVNADAEKFRACFPRGVIELEPITAKDVKNDKRYKNYQGGLKAVVADTMQDTVSRECLRHDEFKNKVKLGRKRDHFIYSIESTGQWDSDELFLEAIKILKGKAAKFEKQVINMVR